MATRHVHIPSPDQDFAAEGILIDLGPSDEPESTIIASTGHPDILLPQALVQRSVPQSKSPTWKCDTTLVDYLGDSWEDNAHRVNDPNPAFSAQLPTAPDTSALTQDSPSSIPCPLASAFRSPIICLSSTVPSFTHQSRFPSSSPKSSEVASELAKEPKVDHTTVCSYEDQWLPKVEHKELLQDGDRKLCNAPQTAAFKTYADASNHFYASLDHSVLEKPLDCPLSSSGPVIPPSHSSVRPKLSKSAPHSVDRPNWAVAAPDTSVQEPPRYAYSIKPSDIIGRKSSTFAHGGQMKPSDSPKPHAQCDDNMGPSLGGEVLPIWNHGSEYTTSRVAQYLPSEHEDIWTTEAVPNWDIPENNWPSLTQLVPTQPASKHEQLASLADKYTRDPPPHQRAKSKVRSGYQGGNISAHSHFENKSSAYHGGRGSTTREGQYEQASLRNNALVPSPTIVGRSYIKGESRVVPTFDDPAAIAHGWGRISDDSASEACTEKISAPELPESIYPPAVFSKRTSRDPNFVLPPLEEEPPQDRTWDGPEWKSYSGKRGRPLRLLPADASL